MSVATPQPIAEWLEKLGLGRRPRACRSTRAALERHAVMGGERLPRSCASPAPMRSPTTTRPVYLALAALCSRPAPQQYFEFFLPTNKMASSSGIGAANLVCDQVYCAHARAIIYDQVVSQHCARNALDWCRAVDHRGADCPLFRDGRQQGAHRRTDSCWNQPLRKPSPWPCTSWRQMLPIPVFVRGDVHVDLKWSHEANRRLSL